MGLAKTILVLLLSQLCLFSCKKKAQTVPAKTPHELLTSGSWKLVEAYENTEKDGARTTNDIYGGMDDCEKDNFVNFTGASHEVVLDEGTIKCDVDAPQTSVSQTWVLVSNTRLEYINILLGNKYEAAIIELSETVFHIRLSGTLGDGTNWEQTYLYNKVK